MYSLVHERNQNSHGMGEVPYVLNFHVLLTC